MNVYFHVSFFFPLFFLFLFNSQLHPCYYSPCSSSSFSLFLPIVLPICILSVASFLLFPSSVSLPKSPPVPLPRIVVHSPKIHPLFPLIPLRSSIILLLLSSLSYLVSLVPICAFLPFSLFFVHLPFSLSFVHFRCLPFLHLLFLHLLKNL
jgi:hypothetical protein